MHMIVFMLVTFLVNSLTAFVLFDSNVSRYFVSRYFSRIFDVTLIEFKRPLRVSIAKEHRVSELSIFWDCALKIFKVSYLNDLIPIHMGDVWVIVGMDWFSRFGGMID